MNHTIKPYYKRDLPHYQPLGDVLFFITTRLDGSLPKEITEKLKEERDTQINIIKKAKLTHQEKTLQIDKLHRLYFGKFDALLDNSTTGNHWLKIPSIAQIVADSLHYFDSKKYELFCYTIMSNHIHCVFELKNGIALYGLLQSFKGYTAKKANQLLDREGAFWQHESYDRVVRNGEELTRIINYILNNPVKAGLCNKWEDWAFNYINPKYKP